MKDARELMLELDEDVRRGGVVAKLGELRERFPHADLSEVSLALCEAAQIDPIDLQRFEQAEVNAEAERSVQREDTAGTLTELMATIVEREAKRPVNLSHPRRHEGRARLSTPRAREHRSGPSRRARAPDSDDEGSEPGESEPPHAAAALNAVTTALDRLAIPHWIVAADGDAIVVTLYCPACGCVENGWGAWIFPEHSAIACVADCDPMRIWAALWGAT